MIIFSQHLGHYQIQFKIQINYMKQIILIFMAITFSGCSLFQKSANSSLIQFCKFNENTIRISYFDSTNGIVRINAFVNNDTLNLSLYVAYVREQKDFLIPISSKIKTICYGDSIIKIESITDCLNSNSNNKTQTVNVEDITD